MSGFRLNFMQNVTETAQPPVAGVAHFKRGPSYYRAITVRWSHILIGDLDPFDLLASPSKDDFR
jgi:hypothetical protein